MSRLHAMQIENIRSFGTPRETIKFETPLTLIVGQNGSGKTTVIECLKFAFTGMQPPNTKVGGAFVHDPRLESNSSVQAMVRISFKSADGAAMTVARRLELTVKKASRSLKTIESSLNMDKRGEKTIISSRGAELDLILPLYLGVSSAILDNVIFCHQDESFWPLSDPTTLKKKFDEIFEAQKYTKAIDNIKQIRKKQNEELGKLKIDEQHEKKNKDQALKNRRECQVLSRDVEALRTEVEDLEVRITHARAMADEAWRKGEDYAKVLGALEGKRIEAHGKQSTIDGLKLHLEEVTESDEWLQNTLDQFQTRQTELRDELQTKQEKYLEHQDQMKSLGKDREEKVKLKGKFEQEKEAHERQLARRKDLVREVAAKHQIREYEYLADEGQVEGFLVKINQITKTHKLNLDRVKAGNATDRREAQSLVNKLTERKAALQDNKVSIRKQMDSNDQQAGEFRRKVDQIAVDEGSKAVAESRIEDVTRQLQAARQSADVADWDNKLHAANVELRSLEETSSKLNDEMVQSTKNAAELAKLSHLKQELKERQKSLETLLNAHTERIAALLDQEWSPATVEKVHQTVLGNASDETAAAERERSSVARELEQVQFKQKNLRADVARKQSEAQKYDKQIRSVVDDGVEGYDDALTRAEEEVTEARQKSADNSSLHDYFELVLKTLNDKHACRTCQRGFKGPSDSKLVNMRERMETMIKDLEEKADKHDPTVAEATYKRLIDIGVVCESWKKLVNVEIPAVEQDLAGLTRQQQALVSKLEENDQLVAQKQQAKRDIESIGRTVASIGKCDIEIESLTGQADDLSEKQTQRGGGRTLEDIREELSAAVETTRAAQNAINRLRSEQEQSRAAISRMDLELRDLQGELNNIKFQLDKKASFATRVEEFRDMNKKQREALDQLDRDVLKLDPEISTAKAKYDDLDQRATARELELSEELSRLSESVNGLNLLNDQIRSYIDRDGPNQLGRTDSELKTLEQQLDGLQSSQGQLTREMNKITERIRDSDSMRRRYSDNLRYRQESRALERLQAEIEELASQNAEADRDRFQLQSQRYTTEHHKLNAEQAGLMGQMKSKDTELVRLLANFQTDYKDAPQRYKEAHIKVETTKAAVEDLGRYGGALDKAIMKYHSMKMEEINGIIEELWRKTYRGTDVDTIMIRAENDTGRGNRSYNYRVVMIKRGAEMDMRGRCSAGQKVLASIIIRLALAECFSSKCGLIALDEPTTNLDRDNIESLAQSLKEIIEYRQQQSNFQLVVITHDEDFLRQMECSKFTGVYYRVSRDAKQNSIIERQNIAEVL